MLDDDEIIGGSEEEDSPIKPSLAPLLMPHNKQASFSASAAPSFASLPASAASATVLSLSNPVPTKKQSNLSTEFDFGSDDGEGLFIFHNNSSVTHNTSTLITVTLTSQMNY